MFSILQKTLNINFVKVFLPRLFSRAVLLGGIDCIKSKSQTSQRICCCSLAFIMLCDISRAADCLDLCRCICLFDYISGIQLLSILKTLSTVILAASFFVSCLLHGALSFVVAPAPLLLYSM